MACADVPGEFFLPGQRHFRPVPLCSTVVSEVRRQASTAYTTTLSR
jgi:hypothetical protein